MKTKKSNKPKLEATEVMIGNLFHHNSDVVTLVSIDSEKEISEKSFDGEAIQVAVRLSNGSAPWLNHLSPIPLHEPWLIKCGFHWSEALTLFGLKNSNTIFETFPSDAHEDNDNSSMHSIHFYHNGNYVVVESLNSHGEYSNLMFQHIKYVHQLQNLYLLMTGKSLEINLDAPSQET